MRAYLEGDLMEESMRVSWTIPKFFRMVSGDIDGDVLCPGYNISRVNSAPIHGLEKWIRIHRENIE